MQMYIPPLHRKTYAHAHTHQVFEKVTEGALLENRLEIILSRANRHPDMKGIIMDALERWRRATGTKRLVPIIRNLPV